MTAEPRPLPDRAHVDQSALRDRLVLLIGARRSGTNWLERVLATHPEVVAMPSETYLFSHGIRPLAELIQHSAPGARWTGRTYMERDAFQAALRDLMDRILLDSMARLGSDARYLLERTPWHAQHLDLIASVYPDARVIHIIRDGRAVARSLMAMPRPPSTIAEAAAEWSDSVEACAVGPSLFAERYTEVRYESLLGDPIGGASQLLGWLSLDVTPDTLERIAIESAAEFNVDPSSPGVRSDKWRDELSELDLAEVERVAGDKLRELGYVEQHSSPTAAPGSAPRGRGALRRVTGAVKRLPATRTARAQRQAAREARADRAANLSAIERFLDALARDDRNAVFEVCADDGEYRLVDGNETRDGRGHEGLERLYEALREHYERGLIPLDSSPTGGRSFTVVLTYRLRDRSEWAQTSVFAARGGRIKSLSVYRFERRPLG